MELEAYNAYIRLERATLGLMALTWMLLPVLAGLDLVRHPRHTRGWLAVAGLAALALTAPFLGHEPGEPWLFGLRASLVYVHVAGVSFVAALLLSITRALRPTPTGEPRPAATLPDRSVVLVILGFVLLLVVSPQIAVWMTPALTIGAIATPFRRGSERAEDGARGVAGLLMTGMVAVLAVHVVQDLTDPYVRTPWAWLTVVLMGLALMSAGLVSSFGTSRAWSVLPTVVALPVLLMWRPFPVEVELPDVAGLRDDDAKIRCMLEMRVGNGPPEVPSKRWSHYDRVMGRPLSHWVQGTFHKRGGASVCGIAAEPGVRLADLPEGWLVVLHAAGTWTDSGSVQMSPTSSLVVREIEVKQTASGATVAGGRNAAHVLPLEVGPSGVVEGVVRARASAGPGPWAVRLQGVDWTLQEGLELCAELERRHYFCHLR